MSTKRMLFTILATSAVLLALVLGSQLAGSAQARPPAQSSLPASVTIPYPGRLADVTGQPAPDGAYDFVFTLYDAGTGGEPLWSEAQTGMAVQGGAFQVQLGSVTSLPQEALADVLWLAVAVRGPGESDFTALAPRQRVSAAPTAPDSPSAGLACPHDHLGEWWTGDPGTGNNGLRVESTRTDSIGITGVAHNGSNATGVFGWTTQGVGVKGSSSSGPGVKGESTDAAGVFGSSANGTGVYGHSDTQIGVFAEGPSFGLYSKGDAKVEGNLYVTGSKSGYVVDIAQNDDIVSLVAGDVVVISGAGPAVLGEIPVIKVRRATAGNTSAVVGIVDEHYVPAPQVASDEIVKSVIDDAAITPGEYLTVVTLGAYKAIKVDAAYGAIAPGDLLVASPNPGYAMRAASPQPGTIIGKALGALPSGTGVIPVIITLQ